jgi:hypothetical protein
LNDASGAALSAAGRSRPNFHDEVGDVLGGGRGRALFFGDASRLRPDPNQLKENVGYVTKRSDRGSRPGRPGDELVGRPSRRTTKRTFMRRVPNGELPEQLRNCVTEHVNARTLRFSVSEFFHFR